MLRWKDKSLEGGMDKDKLQKNTLTYGVLLAALGAMTFFGVCDPTRGKLGSSGSINGPAGEVGGETISRAEFNRAYRMTYDRYQKQFGEQFNPAQMRLAHNVMKELVDERALYIKAVDLGLKASDDEVLNLLKSEFKGENGQFSEEVFESFLTGQGYTEASFMEEVRRSVTVQKMRRFVTETAPVSTKAAEMDYKLSETKLDIEYLKFDPQKIDIKVTDADIQKFLADPASKAKVKEYFDQNAKEFNQAEQVKARHILVQFKGSRGATPEAEKRSKEEAKKKADDIAAKVKAPGADFAELAKQNTDEPQGKTSGGDLGWFAKEAMVPEFSDAAFKANKGDITGVIETPFGFHVIKVEDKKAAVATKLEDAEKKIAETLIAKEKRPALAKEQADKALAALKEKKPVEGATWAATGEQPANTKFLPGIGSSKEVTDAVSTLKAVGDMAPGVIDVRGNYYIVRLKSKKEPDMSKFDKDKQRELTNSATYSEGYQLFNQWEKQIRDEMDKKKKVWMNDQYLKMDDRAEEKS